MAFQCRFCRTKAKVLATGLVAPLAAFSNQHKKEGPSAEGPSAEAASVTYAAQLVLG